MIDLLAWILVVLVLWTLLLAFPLGLAIGRIIHARDTQRVDRVIDDTTRRLPAITPDANTIVIPAVHADDRLLDRVGRGDPPDEDTDQIELVLGAWKRELGI